MTKITREALIQQISDPNIPLKESLEYLHLDYDPARGVKVDAAEEMLAIADQTDTPLTEANVVFQWVVKALRTRRQNIFFTRLHNSPDDDILILDGDSWAQHPFVDELFDQLSKSYNVYCSSLAGRLMKELHDENLYIEMLDTVDEEGHLENVKGIVLSGGGNDLFGEEIDNILNNFDSSQADSPTAHIDSAVYKNLLTQMEMYYRNVIKKIRHSYPANKFPILLHSYAYLTPWDVDTGVLPKDKWVGDPLRKKKIIDSTLQKKIVAEMVDQFHGMLDGITAEFSSDNVILLDNRTALPGIKKWWSDEIHPSSAGFRLISDSFRVAIAPA